MAATKIKQKELTGRHVLLMLLAFFGLIIAINIYFMFVAVTSFRGEDVKGSYRQGLEYNQTLAARATQNKLGWAVSANVLTSVDSDRKLIVKFTDDAGNSLNQLAINGTLRHPTDLKKDMPISFQPIGDGRYEVALHKDLSGQWKLKATALKQENSFSFVHELDL